MLRWLALGAACGAAVMLLLDFFGLAGPWEGIALVLALLAAFAISATTFFMQSYDREIEDAEELVRRSEAEREELREQIERQAQLEQQLRHAKRTAEAAVMAKGEFLATMSHEIRTPLNGIVPMLDLLMHARLAPDHAELVRTAHTSSQHLLRIVDDILDYSKLEADKLELESTAFNVRELLEGVIQLMERPAQSKGLRLHLQIDPGVRLPVRGDPVRLRQVLGNLLSNAVKFTERGSISVSVRRIGESTAQHQLRFEVRDTGVGISKAAQPRLFQAFNQADASTTRLYGGTGLGLAISKRIVELMDGRIGVESEADQGATFWFEVPMLKVQGDIPADERLADGGRLLLLSTDPRLRLRLSMLLPNWGLRVSTVETTQEALNRLRSAASQGAPWAYSIVLADLAGMRHTALALHRNLGRQAIYGDLELVCLYGDDEVPDELRRDTTVLSRQAPDADLRAALIGKPEAQPPLAVDADGVGVASQPEQPIEAPAEAPARAPRSPRVLLVEDNPVNLMVGQRLLSMLGITCDTAGNGEAALMRMSASRYDLVLMDCQMPVMDGYSATRQWRKSEAESGGGRHLPIIAMTANAMAGDRQKCLDAGMDDYLPKPVTRSELERCIYHWWNPDQLPPLEEAIEVMENEPEEAPDPKETPDPESAEANAVEETPATETVQAPPPEVTEAVQSEAVAAPVASVPPTPTPTPMPEPPSEPVATASPSTFPWPASASPRQDTPPPSAAPTTPASAPPPAARPAPPPVIDEEVLGELRAMLGDEVEHLIEVFLEDTPKLLARLEIAASGPDYDGLRDAAHSLKSSSANLGAMLLSAAARRVEQGARERSLERPAVAVALVVNEFARARRQLKSGSQANA
ncbi:MAG: ATP-binding protein [Luteimonas sp.]